MEITEQFNLEGRRKKKRTNEEKFTYLRNTFYLSVNFIEKSLCCGAAGSILSYSLVEYFN